MDTFDDIQIDESSFYEYGECFNDLIEEEENYERDFFQYLNSNNDY
jgi:hypothetical protein